MSRRILPALVLLATCKREADTVMPICQWEVAADVAQESQAGQLGTDLWFAFLLKNYNPKTDMVALPLKDCSGRPVEPEAETAASKCMAGEETSAPLPERALGDADLLVTPLEDGRTLIWVQARHYENGDAVGPVAITEWTKNGIVVRAIGSLRAHANRARMRLEQMGQDRVLVVESDVCPEDNPKKCERVMRLVPMQQNRFVERPFVGEDGKCIGPAAVALYRQTEFARPDGTVRRFELTRNIDFSDGNVVMSETVVIKDRDPKQPDSPPEVFRNANVRRPLVLSAKGIVTKPGLWEPMLAEHGSVALQPKTSPAPEG